MPELVSVWVGGYGDLDETYRLGNVIYNHGAVGVSVVHGGQGLVALLASGVPNLELDCGVLVEGDGLSEEGSADGRLAIRIKLVLRK